MSDFDTLLDFGESEPPQQNGSTHQTASTDEFDPFGPSPTIEAKGGTGGGDLLVDFSVDSQATSDENGITGQVEVSYDSNMADNVNPLYELEKSSEGEATNPLYEISQEKQEVSKDEASNPLYDFMSQEQSNGQENHEVDLLGTTGTNISDDSGVTMETSANAEEDNLMQPESKVEYYQYENFEQDEEINDSMNGDFVHHDDELKPVEEPVVESELQFEQKLEERDEINDQTEQRMRSHRSSSASSVEEEKEDEELDNVELVITEEEEDTEPVVVERTEPVVVERPAPVPRQSRSRSSSKSSSTSEEQEKEEVTKDDRTAVLKEESNIPATMPEDQSGDANSPNKVSSPSDVIHENGLDEPAHDPNIARETREKEEIHFSEMSTIAYKFEMGQVQRDTPETKTPIKEDFTAVEGGVYENEPTVDPNVVRATDRVNVGEELPEIGTAKNIVEKFKTIQTDSPKPGAKRIELVSPEATGPSEYVSEPRAVVEQYEAQVEGGIWESTPQVAEDVIKSDEKAEDVLPERGTAKNVAARFKQLESSVGDKPPPSPSQRAITPDRVTGKVEFVSEPRTTLPKYEGKAESGVFESEPSTAADIIKHGEFVEEPLPEKGTAKNLVSKFKQFESQVYNKPPPSPGRRELTPDKTGKVEYVSEPTKFVERFEGKSDSGVFENQPSDRPDLVKSSITEETPTYERGYARNVAERFKEIEKNAKSPPDQQRKFKEFTPPHDDNYVYESAPEDRADLVRETSYQDAPLPEKGTAKTLASKFRQLSVEASSPKTSTRTRDFTPPKESGVYENDPKAPLIAQNRPAESGVLENVPSQREDVARETLDSVDSGYLPEAGHAKNLLNKFRQIESDSGKTSPSKTYKEFTPPREEPRIQQLLSPRSPAAGQGESVSPSDLPGQYQQQMQAGIYENKPVERDDVAKEQESDWLIGMPQSNVTKGLVSKFKEIQTQASQSQEKPTPIKRKGKKPGWARQKEPEPQTDEKGLFLAVMLEKCASCQKTVYAMERLEMNKQVYHRACFKCSHCRAQLTPGTYSVNEGVIYCTTHFKQLFARKGNYDEGFGREQYKKKWKSEPNLFNLSLTETESET